MSSDAGTLSLLTAKAMLLLRRERELFALRVERERIELWIKVFPRLSFDLQLRTSASLIQEWTDLMVGELNFQVAAVYAPEEGTSSYRLVGSQSHAPAPKELDVTEDDDRFFTEHPSGGYRRRDPEPLDGFARAVGLEKFFWCYLRTRAQPLLLLCGFAAGAGKSHTLNEYDLRHFELSGKHLAALLDNLGLIAELDGERSELAVSNRQLEEAMAQLRRETTERLQLERELRHSQKLEALGRLVAGIGHEINNPLAYVLSNLEYLERELRGLRAELGDERAQALGEAVQEAISGSERIQTIVNATREFSRPLEEPPRAVDLRESFEVAHRIVANELRHRAKLSEALSEVPRVMADPHRLGQVFVNLLMNAVHSMPDNRAENEIRVTCVRQDEQHVTFSVSDNGRGIPERDLDRVFEPFYSTRVHTAGMGLGLSICRGIIDSFGGSIALESTSGRGTTVTVHLRVAPGSPEAEEALRQSLAPENEPSRPARILLIDDEPAILRGLGRVLRGHEVSMALGGREGLELYKSNPFDIVFCDLMMPGYSGMDFVQDVERLGPEHAQRIVLMTGGVVSQELQSFVSKSCSVCVTKPLDSVELRRLIYNSVAHPNQPVGG